MATIAVGADGTTRSLLASEAQGAVVSQVTSVVNGTTVVQNVVSYTNGTVVSQVSGAAEMAGFAGEVVSTEQAIVSGAQSLAQAYDAKVSMDLTQYVQVGAAVTYSVDISQVAADAVIPTALTQIEQTTLEKGQKLVALVIDVNGNVTATTVVVGEGGVVQYNISNTNCIVRFLKKAV